jgi:hypothetical protein
VWREMKKKSVHMANRHQRAGRDGGNRLQT